MFNGLQSALYPRLMRTGDSIREFSYQDTIYTPYISTMTGWLDTINVEEIERRGRELARLAWFRKKMGKFFNQDRYFKSCKNTDKELHLLKRRRIKIKRGGK